ncbi:MAG: ABC transporter ATP-binding protein [Patescibacteria group bacterium]
MVTTKEIIKSYWHEIRRFRGWIFFLFVCIFATSVIQVITPIYYKKLFNQLIESGQLTVTDKAYFILYIVFGLSLSGMFLYRITAFIENYVVSRIMVTLEMSAFRRLQGQSYNFFTNIFTGSLVKIINRYIRSFYKLLDIVIWTLLPITVSVIGILFVLVFINPFLTILYVIWIILFAAANVVFARWKMKYDVLKAEKDSQAGGALADSLSNNLNVKLFSASRFEERKYKGILGEWRILQQKTWNLGEMNFVIQGLFMVVIEFISIYTALGLMSEGKLTIGDLALIQGYLMIFFEKFWGLGRVIRDVYDAMADARDMVQILNMPYEVKDALSAKKLRITKGLIEFKEVYFAYSKTRQVLNGLDFEIGSREKVALVGSSGAGKSTVVRLLLRFYDPNKGKIMIDGQDISLVKQDSLRESVSLVPQEPILFHRSLLENIRYGRRNATDDQVVEAAKRAHCHEFIIDLPKGYETLVGERGVRLSGGERQRVAIARAILKNAPILVLDEATSSLDSESEALIRDALEGLMKNKTVIAIAHRLSTIMQMDRIVVMEKGKIVDSGSHDVLLKKSGTYSKLWKIQAGGFKK